MTDDEDITPITLRNMVQENRRELRRLSNAVEPIRAFVEEFEKALKIGKALRTGADWIANIVGWLVIVVVVAMSVYYAFLNVLEKAIR